MTQALRIARLILLRFVGHVKAAIGTLVALILALVFGVVWFIQDLRNEEKDWLDL
jgi:hypothetical protein